MDEKAMVNDILSGVKAELSGYEKAIIEAKNEQLRKTFQQLRDDSESYQFELYKAAFAKNYYIPACEATEEQIENIRNQFQNC